MMTEIKTKIKKTGTKEWADKNINLQKGCEHGCLYCYAYKIAKHYGRVKTFEEWAQPKLLLTNIPNFRHSNKTFMFPSTHDITPNNVSVVMCAIAKLVTVQNNILLVSKPHLECITAICERFSVYKQFIQFRFTIGTLDDDIAKKWEPGAPSIRERLQCIDVAHKAGFKVSISCEPLLEDNTEIVDYLLQFYPFVDQIWIGAMNFQNDKPKLDYNGIYVKYVLESRVKFKESFRKHLKIK
jgi:DNA repair photolyase